MCRWIAYTGSPVRIEDLILKPEHSLIDQSLASKEGAETTNGDGFGLGSYGDRPDPELSPSFQNRSVKWESCGSVYPNRQLSSSRPAHSPCSHSNLRNK